MHILTRHLSCGPVDYDAFLRDALAQQVDNLVPYVLTSNSASPEQVWLKKTGPRHGAWRYTLLGVLAAVARLPVLRPVRNQGGSAAIYTEARRLNILGTQGLRVPQVLAVQAGGLLLRHLGQPGAPTQSLADEMHHAAQTTPHTVLALWQQGLTAIGLVHDAGTCLSQAFARNLVRCPDGVMGYVDFEDDPTAILPLPLGQLRDLLCYAHSTSLYLHNAGALPDARLLWAAWSTQRPCAMQAQLHASIRSLHWLRHLPTTRRLGRDLQRARMAYALMA